MKKLISLLAAAGIAASAMSFTASAVEYEKYPGHDGYIDYTREIRDGINSGKYFYDFCPNGRFDIMDCAVLLTYYTELTANPDTDWDKINWLNVPIADAVDGVYRMLPMFDIYDTEYDEENDELCFNARMSPLNASLIHDYGDVDGDGKVTASDGAELAKAWAASLIPGDTNCDGSVDASDASDTLRLYAAMSSGTDITGMAYKMYLLFFDANDDGIIDAADASDMLKIYAENSTS